MGEATSYDAEAIVSLTGGEAVRMRPGMYIGDVGIDGYHHLLWEILDNSIDEALNGHASRITVDLDPSLRTASVRDNGRGIPVDMHPVEGKTALEIVLTHLHAGAKFEGSAYRTSGGLHGVGASVANFLCSSLYAEVWRDRKHHSIHFTQGKPGPFEVEESTERGTGTRITLTPDPEIFGDKLRFDPERIRSWLQIKAYLNPVVRFRFIFGEQTEDIHAPGGLSDYVAALIDGDKAKRTHEDAIAVVEENPDLIIEASFGWTESTKTTFLSYANSIPNANGGTHEKGVKAGITAAIRTYMDMQGLTPKRLTITPDDIREGLFAVVSVYIPGHKVTFANQTKDKLLNPEVQTPVLNAVRQTLEQYLLNNRSVAERICERILQAARARQVSRAVTKKASKSRKKRGGNLPGKLADCISTDPALSEIFLVEGDSAGGNAKQARDRHTQAILPLRGKVLNVETARAEQIAKNREVQDIVDALGCGMGQGFDLDALRYHKIILLMDADSDGHHITSLLITLFYRYLPQLITNGHVYLALPPLFKVTAGTQSFWAQDEQERDQLLEQYPRAEVSRFKGLGEMMPRSLKETTLDPSKRTLIQLTLLPEHSDDAEDAVGGLMGKQANVRKEMIHASLGLVTDLDI